MVMAIALIPIHGCERRAETLPTAADDESHGEHDSRSGLGRQSSDGAQSGPGPQSSPVAIDMSLGWCAGHGVPESVCTRCDASLIARFKEAGDWCGGHDLPESQCTICNPEVRELWAAYAPQPQPQAQPQPQTQVQPDAQAKVQPHAQPQAQAQSDAHGDDGWQLEHAPRLLTEASDPLCQVENLQIQFLDASILQKAGIEVEPATFRLMSATLILPAEVEFDATRVTRVTPRVGGVVRAVPVNVGDVVEPGDVLAVMDSPFLGEAKNEYIERWQNLKLAHADFERVQTIAGGVSELMELCRPDTSWESLRVAIGAAPVGEAKSKFLRAHAALQLARSESEREESLVEKNISSEREVQAARSELAAAEADFMAIREEIAFDTQRKQLAASRDVEIARTSLESAKRRLHILGLLAEQIDAVGNEPDEQLSRLELRSPASGRIIERSVSVGESVEPSDELFTVADVSKLWLRLDAYGQDLIRLRAGQRVLLTVDGMSGMSFEGVVSWIGDQVDARSRTVRVRAELPNPDGLLRARMFGQARIILHDNEEVVTVPEEAVQTDGCCQLVFVRESDTVFQPRKVLPGASSNGYVEILQGLLSGEVVATVGSFLMKTEILKGNIGAGCCEVNPGR